MDLQNAIAVITGGASGIGLGIAKAIHHRGGAVLLADIHDEIAEEEAKKMGARASAAKLDVRDKRSFEALAETAWSRHDRVDLFVNNAGVSAMSSIISADEREVDWMMEVNFKGVWRGMSVFGKRMREQKTPSVICNIGSENSLGYVTRGLGVYAGTKHAILGMSDVLRRELPDHMKICVACPGLVNTSLSATSLNPKGAPSEEARAAAAAFMARGISPEEAGEKIAAGIEREDFIIPTHAHAIKFAEARWKDISESFAAHEPYTPESEKYNVETILTKMREARR